VKPRRGGGVLLTCWRFSILKARRFASAVGGPRLLERLWIGSCAVAPMPCPYEQAFIAHRGKIAARYANAGKPVSANQTSSLGSATPVSEGGTRANGLKLAHLCSFAPNRHFSALPFAKRIASLHEDIGSDVETGLCYRALVVLNCRFSQMVQILSASGLGSAL